VQRAWSREHGAESMEQRGRGKSLCYDIEKMNIKNYEQGF
jgi:hypothetical protein